MRDIERVEVEVEGLLEQRARVISAPLSRPLDPCNLTSSRKRVCGVKTIASRGEEEFLTT
jgi:hypothetical protein